MPRLPKEGHNEETAQLLAQLTSAIGTRPSHSPKRWKYVERLPEKLARGPNVRPFNELHTVRLAISILTQGQLEPCIGDTLPTRQIRIWAGQHRLDSVKLINKISVVSQKPPTRLLIRVWPSEFTQEQALQVQIAENLQEPMRSEEKARAIQDLWEFYQDVHGKKASHAQFAREIGRGESEVNNAIRFNLLDPQVQTLVSDGCFTYSFAVQHLSRLPLSAQFPAANHIILNGLSSAKALEYVTNRLDEDVAQFPLFGGDLAQSLKQSDFRISLRTAADHSAQDAAGYFVRVLKLLKLVDPHDRDRVSATIQNILAAFIGSSDQFRILLTEADPAIGKEIARQADILAPFLHPNRISVPTVQESLI